MLSHVLPAPFEFQLYGFPEVFRNNGFVVFLDQHLLNLTFVLHRPAAEKVGYIGFLAQRIPHVLLVAKVEVDAKGRYFGTIRAFNRCLVFIWCLNLLKAISPNTTKKNGELRRDVSQIYAIPGTTTNSRKTSLMRTSPFNVCN